MNYSAANQAKANFDNVYIEPTPHGYVARMAETGYEIGERARPYFAAAARMMMERNSDAWPVQMLDVGCSYGLGSAFVRFGCSFDEMVAFFSSRAPIDYASCTEVTRMWLNVAPPACDIRCVGLDSSEPAIHFAVETGMLNGGIARNFEEKGAVPTEEEKAWFRSCNLLISSGAIGYVTDRTMRAILPYLGEDHPHKMGPAALMTILRMFDPAPVREAFQDHGYRFGRVPGVRLPQRRFIDDNERCEVLKVLAKRGVKTEGWEDQGRHFADLFLAAREDEFDLFRDKMLEVYARDRGVCINYIQRWE